MVGKHLCPHCAGGYKNPNSLSTHVSRAHGPSASGARPHGLMADRSRSTQSVSKQKVRVKSASKRISARDRTKLDVSTKLQEAYRLGHKASASATKELQGEVASLQGDNDTLWYKLCLQLKSAAESAASHAKLLAGIESERAELRNEQMCQVCFEQQRCIALLPCAHYPLCYQCLLVMERAAGANPIACPMCMTATTGHLKLSPGALPCAADKRQPRYHWSQ